MANQEQLTLLEQGAYDWDEWRTENPDVNIDLSGADLSNADLSDVNLSGADLSDVNLSSADLNHANLSEANLSSADLNHANLSEVDFSGADLTMADLSSTDLRDANLRDANLSDTKLNKATISGADLTGANLNSADLSGADLNFANFRDADLSGANLSGTNLSDGIQIDPKWKRVHELVNEGGAGESLGDTDLSHAFLNGVNLSYADLSHTNLSHTNLNGADLSHTNLNDANLAATQARATNFTGANFTGACLEDWYPNSETKLDDVICEYFYRKQNQQERCPSSGRFALGDFKKVTEQVLDTVDLIFRDGVNWKAFTYALEQVKTQHAGAKLAVQSLENKDDGVVVVKLRVSADADKTTVHGAFMQGYEFARNLFEAQYQASLSENDALITAKNDQIVLYSQVNQNQAEQINQLFDLLSKGEEVKKLMAENPNVQQTFTGTVSGVAGHVKGDQNLNVSNTETETLGHLGDLKDDLNQPSSPTPRRVKAALAIIFVIAGAVAATTDFSNNVLEILNKLGIELIQSHKQQLPPSSK